MMFHRIPITPQGFKQLQEKLLYLKKVERPKIINSIAMARNHGDLKENAEYHAAREQQSFLEKKIHELENKIHNMQIINIKSIPNTGKVVFGSTVTLLNMKTHDTIVYKIVGEDESNVNNNNISINAPISRNLIGKKIHDIVDIKTPKNIVSFNILNVEYI